MELTSLYQLSADTQDNHRDLLNPIYWPLRRKWLLTSICCLITFLTGWNATALTATTSRTNIYFSISDATFPHSVWAVTSWNLGAAIAPMIVLPIMEEHGTRLGYLIVYALFFVFVIPQAVTGSYSVFCAVRFVAGCCAGVLQTCMDGVIADVWRDGVKMSVPVSCYVGALLSGVSSGPVFGAIVTGGWGLNWKWILYFQLIIYGVFFVLVLLIFRETRYPVILEAVTKRQKENSTALVEKQDNDSKTHYGLGSLAAFLRGNILRPFHLLFTEPVVFFFTLLSALSYGITFISTQSVAQVYSSTYAFSEPQTGFIQGSIVLGEIVGWIICAGIQDRFYERCALKAQSDTSGILTRKLPEKRLYAAIPASFIALAAGLFIYGFTSTRSISLYASTTGLFLIGIGVVVVMQAIMMYVTDAYAKYAASASAAVCFGENIFAAFLPLGSQGMYSVLGYGWASALLGFVALLLGLAPVVLVWKGESVRKRSPFMREAVYT
jgi:MFS family permease